MLYRLIDPGSEWRLHRHWFEHTAIADLLGSDSASPKSTTSTIATTLVAHKAALFDHLTARWRDLFDARYEVLLYDLTSTYFESDPPEEPADLRRFGYSRDKRSDCVQVVIALIVTPEGFPLAYEVLPGNTADKTTLQDFLAKIEKQYGKADRIWVMDRGIPTEEVLEQMRESTPPVSYWSARPKASSPCSKPIWPRATGSRPAPACASSSCRTKAKPMCWPRARTASQKNAPCAAAGCANTRPALQALGASAPCGATPCTRPSEPRKRKPDATPASCRWTVTPPRRGETQPPRSPGGWTAQLRKAWRREGRYLLRTNLTDTDPARLWEFYLQLTEVEQAFKELKSDLSIRPIHHQLDHRIEAHVFICFLAYCLQVTLKARLRPRARGLDPEGRAGEVRRGADARRASAHHRRARNRPRPPHPAGERAATAARPTQPHPARAAPAEDPAPERTT